MRGKKHLFLAGGKQKADALMLCMCVCVYIYHSREARSIATQRYGGRPEKGFTNSASYDTTSYHVLFVSSVLVAPDVLIGVTVAIIQGARNPTP